MSDDCKSQMLAQIISICDALENPKDVLESDPELVLEDEGYTYDEDEEVWRDSEGEPVDHVQQSAWDWLSGALDTEYTISRRGDFLGATVCVAFGGPGIWVDTRRNVVKGAWGGDMIERSYSDNIGLGDACEELFNILKGSE